MRNPVATAPDIFIRLEDPAQPDIVELLRQGEANSARLYPAESNHHLPLDALRAPEVRFFVARDAEGRALGTGAVVLKGDWAEVKRMWVIEEARGRGLSKTILAMLVSTAQAEGARMLRLETGNVSHAALALYRGAGFKERGPFEGYGPDPLSVFMEKTL
ncbi:GNAT family N-acetyltransferase [Terrarubrum flagellatum]|uniref:GNAT family N-acetyltransferase n=1 Tax=Terrirubrum flagellatum TaxID=2895980 RepID=UPI0031450474